MSKPPAKPRRRLAPATAPIAPGASPSSLLEQFVDLWEPNGRGWASSRARSGSAQPGASSRAFSWDHVAWATLAIALEDLETHSLIRRSPEVQEFVAALCNACEAGLHGGADEVFALFGTVLARRAAKAKRGSGDDTRQRVLDHWQADVRAGGALRGRQARVAKAAKLEARTVSNAVKALAAAGLIDRGE